MDVEKKIKIFLGDFFSRHSHKLFKLFKLVDKNLLEEKKVELVSNFQSVGSGFQLEGNNWYVSLPGHMIIGNKVRIGGNIYFETEGGLVIGDHTFISSGATITTLHRRIKTNGKLTSQKKPVYIGEHVWIGTNVSIDAGVKIGNGAVIGMGSVITEDVRSGERVNISKKSTKFDGINISSENLYPSYLDIPSNKLCFVLGTGRCGSKSMAKNLNKHPNIFAQHENIRQFIRLSTEYAHKQKTAKEIKSEVKDIFRIKTIDKYQSTAIVHSDQRFWNMIPFLKNFFPHAKFIHLIRDGRDTVRSMYARNWFADDELAKNRRNKDKQWAEYRLNGFLTGTVDKQTWNNWNAFERCCWYWSFINESIDAQLTQYSNTYLLRLETINSNLPNLLDFLDVENKNFKFEKFNRVQKKDKRKYQFQWNDEEEQIFQRLAGETQSVFYESQK